MHIENLDLVSVVDKNLSAGNLHTAGGLIIILDKKNVVVTMLTMSKATYSQ